MENIYNNSERRELAHMGMYDFNWLDCHAYTAFRLAIVHVALIADAKNRTLRNYLTHRALLFWSLALLPTLELVVLNAHFQAFLSFITSYDHM